MASVFYEASLRFSMAFETLCNPLFTRLERSVSLLAVAVIARSSANPTSVTPAGISDSSTSSYSTFHSVGPITEPCGTTLFILFCLISFSVSSNIFRSDRYEAIMLIRFLVSIYLSNYLSISLSNMVFSIYEF